MGPSGVPDAGTVSGENQGVADLACCRNTSLLTESVGCASKGREKSATLVPKQATLGAVEEREKVNTRY